jgi:hypothetical protein
LSTIWSGVWLLFATPSTALPSTDVLSLTAVAALAVLAVLAAGALLRAAALGGTTSTPVAVGVGPIDSAHGVPRLRDPDAAGRPRPRAPSANQAA